MTTIYVSSTYADLAEYRGAVIGALRRMNYQVKCMEDYGATDQRATDRCLNDVDSSDAYLGLVAWRYGYVPEENNPAGRSITELEYRRAIDRSKPCLIFILDENQPWPRAKMDVGHSGERITALRTELLRRHLCAVFRCESDLIAQVATAVHTCFVRKPFVAETGTTTEETSTLPRAAGLKRAFVGHSEAIGSVAISASAGLVASGGWDKLVYVWELDTGRRVRKYAGHGSRGQFPAIVRGVRFSRDGSTLVSCGHDGAIRIWKLSTIGPQPEPLNGHVGEVASIALSGDARMLVSGGADGIARVWDLEAHSEIGQFAGHRAPIRSIDISFDGSLAITGGVDGTLCLWEVKLNKEASRFRAAGALTSVSFSSDASLALSSDISGAVILWDVTAGLEVRRFLGHDLTVRQAALSDDLRRAVTVGNDCTMRVWDLSSGNELARYDDHRCAVTSVALSEDARTAVTGAADGVVRMWNLV